MAVEPTRLQRGHTWTPAYMHECLVIHLTKRPKAYRGSFYEEWKKKRGDESLRSLIADVNDCYRKGNDR